MVTIHTVLVVDDSAGARRHLCDALAAIPWLDLRQAGDGAEAWRLLAGDRFAILITDLDMPLIDGLKLAAMVRQGGPHRAIPIVVVTTESAAANRGRFEALGIDAWLEKPVEPAVLVEVVRSLLGIG
jgi:two-component system chemotaxis response regulator CheY